MAAAADRPVAAAAELAMIPDPSCAAAVAMVDAAIEDMAA
jgi:hypothetical protein